MFRILFFIRRKPHLTHEEFRHHFERSHAAMAKKFCGHLFTEYRRNYVPQVMAGGDSRDADSGFGPRAWEWDVISEWVLDSEERLREIFAVMESPGIRELFEADEDRLIDRRHTVMVPCQVADTGTVFDPAGTVFDTPDGVPRWD